MNNFTHDRSYCTVSIGLEVCSYLCAHECVCTCACTWLYMHVLECVCVMKGGGEGVRGGGLLVFIHDRKSVGNDYNFRHFCSTLFNG